MNYYINWTFGNTPTEFGDFDYYLIYAYPIMECIRAIQSLYFTDYPVDETIPEFYRLYRLGFEEAPETWFLYQNSYYYWIQDNAFDYYLVSWKEIQDSHTYIEQLANSQRFLDWQWYDENGSGSYIFFGDRVSNFDKTYGLTDSDTDNVFSSISDLLNNALGYGFWAEGSFYITSRGIEEIRKALESIGGFLMSFEAQDESWKEAEGEYYYMKVYSWYYEEDNYFDFDYLEYEYESSEISIHYGDYEYGNVYWTDYYEYADLIGYSGIGDSSDLSCYWTDYYEYADLIGYSGIGDSSDLSCYWTDYYEYADLIGYGTWGDDNNAFWTTYNYSDSATVNAPTTWTDASDTAWSLT